MCQESDKYRRQKYGELPNNDKKKKVTINILVGVRHGKAQIKLMS